MNSPSQGEQINNYYQALYRAWGRQQWWPARTRFEVIVGAYLTQNTSWNNVNIALRSMRAAGVLSLKGVRGISLPQLESLIRSSGYFRQKARRLKTFVGFLDKYYGGSLTRMFAQPTEKLREELLGLNGVGPETADSILLYAGQHPVFVVDAYTRRILDRHGILPAMAPYEEIRHLFQGALAAGTTNEIASQTESGSQANVKNLKDRVVGAAHPPSTMSTVKRSALVQIYNEMHGLIVGVGKSYCMKSKPRCEDCPLQSFLPQATTRHDQSQPHRSME
jgi:endonuclease III related protein